MKKVIFSILFLFSANSLQADQTPVKLIQSVYTPRCLNGAQIERLKDCKNILGEVDNEPLYQKIEKLDTASNPEENLQILEAVAKTYAEIIQEREVEGLKKREWLHSMIQLNMAYLQLGGMRDKSGDHEPLNGLIRRKLKRYLPKELQNNTEIFYTLE
jgi:hypothetical protein